MDATVLAALIGAAGALLVGLVVWGLREWSQSLRDRRAARLALAREVIRFRGDQERATQALNELPVLFGEDEELMHLYRKMQEPTGKDDTLLDIVIRLGDATGVSRGIRVSDLRTYLTVRSTDE